MNSEPTAAARFRCHLCQQNVEDTSAARSMVCDAKPHGASVHTACLDRVTWSPEVQFLPGQRADGTREVLSFWRANKGDTPLQTWSGLRVRVHDATRRDHRCASCQQPCGDDRDPATTCVVVGPLQSHSQWHRTEWMHVACVDAELRSGRLRRVAAKYKCFSGLHRGKTGRP